jgi:tRNA pseudouridine13 synthase
VVRGIDDAAAARACARFESIRALGLPNRYGAQRFGRDAQNAARGAALLGGRERVRDRRTARFLVSALQAAVFNAALDRRTLPLDAVEPGDVAVVHASGGLFRVETLAREAPRAARFEISATGPLPGARVLEPTGAPAAREREALAACGLDPETPIVAPRGLRLRGARRPLRVPVAAAALVRDGSTLRLSFHLPPGAYATVLVDELLAAAGIEPQPAVGSRPGAGGLP